jgi:hypothetical protein
MTVVLYEEEGNKSQQKIREKEKEKQAQKSKRSPSYDHRKR